jgi:AraC-like DNA-binding protein
MAYVLLNRFVDLHHEVEDLNVRLEEKVNERNMEILFRDIGARLFMEMLRDLRGDDSAPLRRLIGSRDAALSRDIGIISDAGELFSRVVAKASEITGAQGGHLVLTDDNGELEAVDVPDDIMDGAKSAFADKIAVTRLRGEDRGGEAAMVHLLCVPVLSGGIGIGACCLQRSVTAGPFPEGDIQLLSAFMRQVAPTIDNALVYRKMRRGRTSRPRPSISPRIEEKLKAAMAYIEENYTSDISRENLAASLNMHPDTLSRCFKLYTDRKIAEYVNELRVREAARRIKTESGANIIDIAFAAGFESLATFNRAFVRTMRCTPTEYREKLK